MSRLLTGGLSGDLTASSGGRCKNLDSPGVLEYRTGVRKTARRRQGDYEFLKSTEQLPTRLCGFSER